MRIPWYSFLMAGMLASPSAAQTCTNQGSGPVNVGAFSYEEPGESGIECFEADVPKGRRFIALVYNLTLSDHINPPAGYADSRFRSPLTVTAGGNTIYEVPAPTPANFTNPPTTATDPFFRTFLNYTKRFEKVIDVTALAASGPVRLRIEVRGVNIAPTPRDAGSFMFNGAVHTDIRFTLTETPYSFRPKDSSDPAATSGCQGDTDINCFPTYTAELAYAVPDAQVPQDIRLNGKIKFLLQRISGFPGNSTNLASGIEPDYRLDPGKQVTGLFDTMTAVQALSRLLRRNESIRAVLKITSLDNAGTAQLKAEFFPGTEANDGPGGDPTVKVQAEIKATEAGAPSNEPAVASCQCASLPYDRDGNDIADSWEKEYARKAQVGDFFPNPRFDEEQGPGATTPRKNRGDGFSVHDEYRGFHHILPGAAPGDYRWESTDPVDFKDVFIWDTSTDGKYWTAINSILKIRTSPAMVYRKVDFDIANPVGPTFMSGVKRFNRNGRFVAIRGFAIPIGHDASLNGPGAVCGSASGGVFGNAGAIGMDSAAAVPTSTAVRVDETFLGSCATPPALFPVDVLRAQVVAHEVSHKLDLEHYRREARLVAQPTPLTALKLSEFSIDPTNPNAIHVRLKGHKPTPTTFSLTERINGGVMAIPNDGYLQTIISMTQVGPIGANATTHVFQVQFSTPLTAPVGLLLIDTQHLRIMDFGIRINQPIPNPAGEPNLRDFAGWDFFPLDLEDTCLVCPQRKP